ncbi:hypothetical protein RYX36_020455 [Vicia faba]
MGPKLYVNNVKVPCVLEISEDNSYDPIDKPDDRGYYEPVKWSMFSHVYTTPLEIAK